MLALWSVPEGTAILSILEGIDMEAVRPSKDDWEVRDEVLKGRGGKVLPDVLKTLCLPTESPKQPTDSLGSTVIVHLAPRSPRELPSEQSAR